ncbi:CHC2 zinc finger domain-containing protein [Streptomyces sp. NBC_01198]|nr:CHC2 zinc finger domain-containing protein [Streptomyces sp. NBC_01198]
MVSCPLHDDRTPSMSINLGEGLFKCQSCGVGGDSYTLIMQKEACDFRGACALAASLNLAEGTTGGGDERLSGSRYGGGRRVPAGKGSRAGGGGYTPTWRRK